MANSCSSIVKIAQTNYENHNLGFEFIKSLFKIENRCNNGPPTGSRICAINKMSKSLVGLL